MGESGKRVTDIDRPGNSIPSTLALVRGLPTLSVPKGPEFKASLAQQVERSTVNRKAIGSNPIGSE